MRRTNSLHGQLLCWLLVPQLVLWLAGVTLFYPFAIGHVNNMIDKDLLGMARSLSALAQLHDGSSRAGVETQVQKLLNQHADGFFYSIRMSPDSQQYGNRTLILPPFPIGETPSFYIEQIDDDDLRAVVMVEHYEIVEAGPQANLQKRKLTIQVARQNASSLPLYREVFLSYALPFSLLMLACAWLTWWGVGRGLRSLDSMQRILARRAPTDETPFQYHDIPQELAPLFAKFNHLLAAAQASIAHQRRFIGDAAHQLRTPLAGLKSQTELAMREAPSDALRNRLALVHTSATRSIHLVNQLLILARSEPGAENSILRVHMDLARLIRELTAEAVPRAITKGYDLGCETDQKEAWIEGNSALLRELFLNLIENAIKYTPRGSTITVHLIEESRHYVVEVEDNGPGIPDEDKPRVFERFFRRHQDTEGCGLGMAIVKEIAERHGGSVSLRDSLPHGLTVRVTLPRS